MKCHNIRNTSPPVPQSRHSKQQGLTLVELMIALAMGLLIAGGVVQLLISSQVTERLNSAIASAQEGGRFIIHRLRTDLLMVGRYDALSPNLERSVDIVDEASFVQNRPIILPGDFAGNATLGSTQGGAGGNDNLVVGLQARTDCRGYKLGYLDNEEFFVVNQYYLEDGSLKCRGFDGRVLRGLKAAEGNNGDAGFTLLDDVQSFQVLYGVSAVTSRGDNTGRPVNYVTADRIADIRAQGGQVVAIRIAILLAGDGEAHIDPKPSFKLLNEDMITVPDNRLYKVFETTVTLRNTKNFTRSRRT
ncbi:PilW family protein [Alteromonas sp. a30]|uniref:PilW family protein n=1 Tax=Alteromonas sp. a30 TaxID=2730917 RepID=UPI00227DBFE1|nr:PilW family protein [Alteromonas sp. a30]MCY7295935.1 prepilin-type N-terminal cleavage/methylation domain-containing protein [Alteromonas sp. a30]